MSAMTLNYSVILVHKGSEFYDYINDCILQILKFNQSIIYIVSNDIHKNKVIKNAQVFLSPSKAWLG